MINSNINPNPIVCIWCTVYNHEPFLRDCLEGFLMQKTDFTFVAVVHDDASSDNSAQIIQEYAEKFPHIILPIYEKENQWSKPGNQLKKILRDVVSSLGVKYVALCEGDDYWINPKKLQYQVDFLENHSSYSMCYSAFYVVDENNNRINLPIFSSFIEESYSGNILPLLFDHNFVLTLTTCFRKEVLFTPEFIECPISIDYSLFFANAFIGKAHFSKEKTSCYRKHQNSLTGSNINYVYDMLEDAYQYWGRLFFVKKTPHMSLIDRINVEKKIFGFYYRKGLESVFPNVHSLLYKCYSIYRRLKDNGLYCSDNK